MRLRNRLRILFVTTALALSVCVARCMDLYTYDLDSLVEMSSTIVEGKIIRQHQTNNIGVWEIEISNPHVGGFAVGQKIDVTALDFYSIGPWGSKRLEKGDELFLFLDRAKPTFLYQIPTNAEIYWLVPSGVKFISGEKAVGFWQWNNPGPYVADIETAKTNPAVPTVTEFRCQIQESIKRVEQWNKLLKKETSSADITALLSLLRERGGTNQSFRERDEISEEICGKIAKLHDPDSILKARLLVQSTCFGIYPLGQGLATTEGRKFLAEKLADPTESPTNRLKWAVLINDAAGFIGPHSFFRYEPSDDGATNVNEHFLKQIAELSANPQTDTNLQMQLLQELGYIANISHPTLQITDDGKEAESIIKAFWKNTKSEELKYAAETILYPLGHAQTNSEFEPVIAILKPETLYHKGRALSYDLEYESYQKGPWTPKLVLVNLKTHDKTILDMPTEQIQSGQGGTSNSVQLPANLPPGRYRAYVEFFDGDKLAASSHYFETDL